MPAPGRAGKRSRGVLELFLAVVIAVVTASCAAAPDTDRVAVPPAVTNLAQVKAVCAAVGRALGAPPGGQGRWIREIVTAPRSTMAAVNGPLLKLAGALRANNTDKTNQAFSDMVRACAQLGLWQTYH